MTKPKVKIIFRGEIIKFLSEAKAPNGRTQEIGCFYDPFQKQTTTRVAGMREIDFSGSATSEQLAALEKAEGVRVATWTSEKKEDLHLVTGYLDDLQFEAALPAGFDVHVKGNFETFNHLPLPAYLYSYLPAKVECGDCHKLIDVEDIETDYDDDGNRFTNCPECGEINTFEFEYEKISDVINEGL